MHGFGPDYLYVTVALNRTKTENGLFVVLFPIVSLSPSVLIPTV